MGIQSTIEWTNSTWNPWYGCQYKSPGCINCYAERQMKMYGLNFNTVTKSKTKFEEPLKWKSPRMVFNCSWSDFFIKGADEWRNEAWDVIRRTPQHTYQILTKRPENITSRLPHDWPLPNVWLGVSVENKKHGLRRIPELIKTPATVHFLSVEPLLEDLGEMDLTDIEWIIVGGESGPKFRPIKPDWVRSIRDQCNKSNVAFFFKQWAGISPKKLGRILDGVEYSEFPLILDM